MRTLPPKPDGGPSLGLDFLESGKTPIASIRLSPIFFTGITSVTIYSICIWSSTRVAGNFKPITLAEVEKLRFLQTLKDKITATTPILQLRLTEEDRE
jgi:hypothetical protein